MEFSYSISANDYVRGVKLRLRSWKTVVLRLVVTLGLFAYCLWLIFPDEVAEQFGTLAMTRERLLLPWGPVLGVLAFWMLVGWPWALRNSYRKNPSLQSVVQAKITRDSVSVNTITGRSEANWSAYKSWKEGRGLIVLILHSNIFQILNVAGLTDIERYELRGILRAALSRKG